MASTIKTQRQPPRHGVIHVNSLKPAHARQHLATITANMAEVKDYGSHGTGFSSQGGFQQGGASGADYETSSADNVGDADSAAT
jgi:hypothetical protein